MNFHEQAQRMWAAVNHKPDEPVAADVVARERYDQLVRLRYILADMGPSGLDELTPEAIQLVLHCIRSRETSRWYPTGVVSERVDRYVRGRQR